MGTLRTARGLLADDGRILVADERVADAFTAPGDPTERFMYGWSILHCLPATLAEHPVEASGTVLRTPTVARWAAAAGFTGFEVLPIDNPLWRSTECTAEEDRPCPHTQDHRRHPAASGTTRSLGASMAGLLAARVLADAYAQVTVIDRDQLPQAGSHRRGVPQGRHLHALLARGQQALEELFPGLTAELVAHGVPTGDVLGNGRWYLNGHRLGQTHTGLVALCASRPSWRAMRGRVRALPNLRFLDACDLLGLATTPDGGRVTGTRVRRRVEGGAEELLRADLVVDATGRGSRTQLWLEALGYPRPPTEQVRIGLGYTRTYRLPPDPSATTWGSSTPPRPPIPAAARCCWWRATGGW